MRCDSLMCKPSVLSMNQRPCVYIYDNFSSVVDHNESCFELFQPKDMILASEYQVDVEVLLRRYDPGWYIRTKFPFIYESKQTSILY